jgi:hypothetical protein
MAWELSGDDPGASLLKSLRGRFAGAPPLAHCLP